MIKLTDEQKFIVEQHVKNGERFKITAFAGTGKTSTLIAYARLRPQMQFLYLAFNKSMQLQAAKRFPRNVLCKTIHSLAWPSCGNQYSEKIGNLKPYHISDSLDLPNLMEARFILDTLMNFIASSDSQIYSKHVPFISKPKLDYVDLANRIWKLMCDPFAREIPMEHDGYLKLFQLKNIQLEYDAILLDEAQDCNPVSMGIIENQIAPVILVGDIHQQLYSFRGAINAMDELNSDYNADLTGSFRFSSQISNLATSLVASFKDEDRILHGLGGPTRLDKVGNRFAYLARTNAGLFDQAVDWHKTKKIFYLGGIEQLKLDQLIAIWQLWNGSSSLVCDAFVKRFKHFSQLEDYAKSTEDKEFQSKITIVEKYRYELPALIRKINKAACDEAKVADCLFTTVHRAKGLEFKEVRLHNDFTELTDSETIKRIEIVEPEEVNIIYVAITRAKEVLELNEDLDLFKKLVPTAVED